MKNFLIVVILSGLLISCKPSTSTERYTSVWKPDVNTQWYKLSKTTGGMDTLIKVSNTNEPKFFATSGGYEYTVMLPTSVDTTFTITFSPAFYVVSNPQTGTRGEISFTTAVLGDTNVFALDSNTVTTKIDTSRYDGSGMKGFIKTIGQDSNSTYQTDYIVGANNLFLITTKPDRFSTQLRFSNSISWKKHVAPANSIAKKVIPATASIKFVFSNVLVKVIDVELMTRK